MKKVLVTTLLILGTLMSKAQGQGRVFIINQLSCEVYIDVVAVCPDDCTVYGSGAMNPIPHRGAPGYPLYDPATPGGATYFTTTPTCTNWQWSYADFYFWCPDGSGSYTYRIGNPNDPCFQNVVEEEFQISQQCANTCNGGNTTVNVKWYWDSPAPGDVTIVFQ